MNRNCSACDEKFVWDDEVILVDNELYHRDCVELYPQGYFVMLNGDPLGESENDDGSSACDYIDDLLDEEESA